MIHKHNRMITIIVIMISNNDNPTPLILNTPFETMVDVGNFHIIGTIEMGCFSY
jgi:hypothetical protein